jgi:hypothetical protein
MTMLGVRPLIAAPLLIFVFAGLCPGDLEALDCGVAYWRNYDRVDGVADPAKRRQDAEARAALANLRPIIFRGRVARARTLSGGVTDQLPLSLIIFEDVEVLRGEMPRSAHDRKAFIVHHGWCDGSPTSCRPASRWWPRGQIFTVGVHPSPGGPVTDTVGKRVVHKGRVDAEMRLCDPSSLTPLEWNVLNAPADEIARLMREYPFHPVRKDQPAGSE